MPAPKHPEPPSGKPATTAATTTPAPAPAAEGKRKPWIKKSPVQVVLDQEKKLKEEIAAMEEEIKQKRQQLQKFEQARKIFEGS